MDVTPRSLILDLLSTMGRGAMPVRVLVQAGAMFGLADNSMRVALARLVRSGHVARDERGLYRLGEAAQALNRRVVSWRRVDDQLRAWRGEWAAVIGADRARGDRARRRAGQHALDLLGFRPLEPGLLVRPDNLAGGVASLRATLSGLGLDPAAAVARLGELDPRREARARALWDGRALVAGHREAREAIEASGPRLEALPRDAALVESFRLGGAALRSIVRDPLLPDALVPGDERRALVEAMKTYDRLGRDVWREFLSAHGVVQQRTPLDTRQTDRPLAAIASEGPRAAAGGSR